MQGFLSRDRFPPSELLQLGRDEARRYGVEFVRDNVVSVEPGFSLLLDEGGRREARRLLIATGAIDELPPIEGAHERCGRDFLHCPYCHGWEVRDQPLGIISTGPGSVEHAQLLREWSDDLVFFSDTSERTPTERSELETRGICVVDGEVRRLVIEDDLLKAVALADGHRIERTAVFIRPRMRSRVGALLAQFALEVYDLVHPRRRRRTDERSRSLGRRQHRQPARPGDHRRRRRLRRRNFHQRRPRPGGVVGRGGAGL
jgi:thioredoxin reductase